MQYVMAKKGGRLLTGRLLPAGLMVVVAVAVLVTAPVAIRVL